MEAVRRRLQQRDAAEANVRTFDSFASQLLLDGDKDPVDGYEARVRQATKLLLHSEDLPLIDQLRHVIIDEIQDLVGDRADFVLALLRRLDSDVGFTALGDPLQAVYDFQLRESRSKTTVDLVRKMLLTRLRCRQVGLGPNYRARGSDPKGVVALGEVLRKLKDSSGALAELRAFEASLLDLGGPETWATMIAASGVNAAVLCATNAEVMLVSGQLRKRNIRHAVRRRAQDFGAGKWVAQSLSEINGPRIRRSEAEAALEVVVGLAEAEEMWYLLKAAEGDSRRPDALDIRKLHSVIRSGAMPLAMTEPDLSRVIVSTVHRAKGLEFDTVLVVEPSYRHEEADDWTEVRRYYVALSRAREDIYLCRISRGDTHIREEKFLSGRLLDRGFFPPKRKWWTKAMEFQYHDVDTETPPMAAGTDAAQVQGNLTTEGLVGAWVNAVLDVEESTADRPSYLLFTADDTLLGRTSESFNTAFVIAFNARYGQYPTLLEGLTLVSVETVAGDPRKSECAGIGSTGLWLVPRVIGMADPDWSEKEDFS